MKAQRHQLLIHLMNSWLCSLFASVRIRVWLPSRNRDGRARVRIKPVLNVTLTMMTPR